MVSATAAVRPEGKGVRCCVVAHDAMPPDPFAGDPFDPASELEALDEPVEQLELYQLLLEPRGIRGIVVDCADCDEPHYHEWELLQASLRQLLRDGRVRPHEPACEPDSSVYVSWEYCRGYADATLAYEVTGD